MQFVSDQKHWGTEDYWATPVEFLVSEIKPAGQRKDLQPVYNFNGDGLWLARERGKGALRVGEAERISLWSNVRKRLKLSVEKWMGKRQPVKKTRTTP